MKGGEEWEGEGEREKERKKISQFVLKLEI